MLGLGKHPLTACSGKLLIFILLQSLVAQFSLADDRRIQLRNGPGDAFSVVFEVSSDHGLKPIRLQGEWLLLGNERIQGWAHRSDISQSVHVSESQLWLIRQKPIVSQWNLQFGGSSQRAVNIALAYPVKKNTLALRAQRRAFGESAWQSLSLALETDLKRFGETQTLRAGAFVGVGVNEEGSSHWSDDQTMLTTGLVGLNLDWHADLNKQLSMIMRLNTEQALSGNSANHNEVSLIWNLKI